ncbi:type-F conjugative transfer system pilin assembly protein TrbC, partial [Salmonella enterica subsp. enterica serovar Typhimurium]|nr:type-F conjugative transfer system pilin assembly protein TrbC [Salmonella enterica]EBL5403134.1 type-F conjugative transfer system pilin assembly protein TrbC [Salmonella enterica subsp. enterica serovar Typhimurium]EEK7417860.1 type-F conjugative transfer system pilin assembly protein TrbC [Salmonella enterica subsp. enterica serovar Typhimurium]EEK7545654.1 type-F conjugative transfer system pilin assembly protein TrbC [Salmonella enterica subsp. enterica serovar Typhimurium]
MHRKIKYLAGLIMVISGTVSAGGVANTPENRQFLKQQEELSRQLRDRPDAELKAWADRQIQANPLVQSDRHFLDDLARKQQTSQADKPEQGAVYFISFSIPEEGL